MSQEIDIEDIEAFIDGLKTSFDTLEGIDPNNTVGFQAQIAKTISALRIKRMDKIEPLPEFIGHVTKEDIKNFLLNKLEQLNNLLDAGNFNRRRKFNLVMEIATLRAKIRTL